MGSDKYFLNDLFGPFLVTPIELINTTGGIYQYILSGVERMGGIGNFQLYQRILITVLPFYSFLGRSG